MTANLFSRLFDDVKNDAKASDRLAIETPDGGRISYCDLIERSGRAANYLVSRGVKVGDRARSVLE